MWRCERLRMLLACWILVQPMATGWSQPSPAPDDGPEAIIIVIGGVGALDLLGWSADKVIPKSKIKYHVREFNWTHGWGQLFKDLQDHRHLERKAEELAQLVRRLQAHYPGKPIFFLAKSGGTGLALRAAELLPDATLERVILLSAAVSPEYDLSAALRATRREIVSFHSPHDQFILNWGTSQFGTIDRVYGPSAGLHGFRVPRDADEPTRDSYRRLVQVRWQPRMIVQGHTGGHAGTSLPSFLQTEVMPWLR